MPSDWLSALDSTELKALIPGSAARDLDDIDRAELGVANDMMPKGLICKSYAAPCRAAKRSAKKKPGYKQKGREPNPLSKMILIAVNFFSFTVASFRFDG